MAELVAWGGGPSRPGARNTARTRRAGRALAAPCAGRAKHAPCGVPHGAAKGRYGADPGRPARRAGGTPTRAIDPGLRPGQGGGSRSRCARRQHLGRRTERVRLVRSEEHTYELESLMRISYAGFCSRENLLEKKRSAQHKTL